jgi:DnaJ-class molecular chaperone
MRPKDRQRSEELFKELQTANNQIGDALSRKKYESMANSPFTTSSNSGNPFTHNMNTQDFYRTFRQQQNSRGRTPFYVNGIDISELFSSSPFGKPAFWGGDPLKSVYVQKVQVPLQDLYSGRSNVELVLKDNLWKRYRAAIRGGVFKSVFFQGLLFSIPVYRVSIPLSMIITACLVHCNIPRPFKCLFDCNVQKGWKAGTKLTFKEFEPGFDVVFVIQEQKHGRYARVGNDLHTNITIRRKQAKEGCVVEIEPLGTYDSPIRLALRPNQVKYSGQQITLQGKGWPRRQGGGYGDLVVTVNLQSNFHHHARGGKRASSMR